MLESNLSSSEGALTAAAGPAKEVRLARASEAADAEAAAAEIAIAGLERGIGVGRAGDVLGLLVLLSTT